MIENSIVVTNAKGGCGKTTLSASLAGFAARDGWHVLLVETDPQSNTADLLGVDDHANDEGASMIGALEGTGELNVVRDVRDGLDVVFCGSEAATIDKTLAQVGTGRFEEVFGPVAEDYDLVVVDTAPSVWSESLCAVFDACRFAIIPTEPVLTSIKGLTRMSDLMLERYELGTSQIETLGVVANKFYASHKRMDPARAKMLADLRALLPENTQVFATVVHHLENASQDSTNRGLLPYEYEQSKRRWRSDQGPKFAAQMEALCLEILTAYQQRSDDSLEAGSDDSPATSSDDVDSGGHGEAQVEGDAGTDRKVAV